MPRVLITTEAQWRKPGAHVDALRAAGYEVDYPATRVLLSEEETARAVADCVAVIAGSEPYTDSVLAQLPELRVIARHGVGYDKIDVPAATRRGIAVAITPDANHEAVAEHAMALMLALARRIVTASNDTRSGKWSRGASLVPLRGRTLGIVGLGRIGRSVAKRAAAFGMKLIACDEMPNREFAAQLAIELVTLDELLSRADVVTLHLPMNAQTSCVICGESLARMKRGSLLVNTARGGLVNESDLESALQTGHLAGAALDVLATEPPAADHPLLRLPNVIVTPHIAGFDAQALSAMAMAAAQNILELLSGGWPAASIVNPDVRQAWHR
ncbi:MAG TPA: phosphoglycerate dehydrogenase [Pirellulales bacterium]|jgi:D-3-phosphoglycerate dehydrogenase|nr:phosphoglycerate dehydrogenase [Pirellulales bacterium]